MLNMLQKFSGAHKKVGKTVLEFGASDPESGSVRQTNVATEPKRLKNCWKELKAD